MIVPDPARGKDHESEGKQECVSYWEETIEMAEAVGTVTPFTSESLKAWARAVHELPPALTPGSDYKEAFDKAVVGYIVKLDDGQGYYWVGLWDLEECQGASIGMPEIMYKTIRKLMGREA